VLGKAVMWRLSALSATETGGLRSSRAQRGVAAALLTGSLGALGCIPAAQEPAGPSASESELVTVNGLTMINGLTMTNGLALSNGLTMINGLSSMAGLTSGVGLMTTSAGRTTVSYLVRCALPLGHTVTKTDQNGTPFVFLGQVGVAPEWESGACGPDCQENVSACMLAHVNTSGQHIGLWLDSDNPAIGWGRNNNFPYQEGSFFGNIFANPPQAYFCNGKDFELGVVPGRLGVGQAGAPYVNPFPGSGYCQDACTPADAPHVGDGYKACKGFPHVVTVWRNFDPTTSYKICNRSTGRCLDTYLGGAADLTKIVTSAYNSAPSQKWRIVQFSPGNYKLTNTKANRVLDVWGGIPFNGVDTILYGAANAATSQLWNFLPTGDGSYRFTPGTNIFASLTDGLTVEQWTYAGLTSQQWTVAPVN
jgi:hypothetical protein